VARRTKEEAKETKDKILLSALDVFCEKGYYCSTFVDVAERIGLSKGAVYWHFKTKRDLLVELMNTMFVKVEKLISKNAQDMTTLDDLKIHFIEHAHVICENAECHRPEIKGTQSMAG
jgi:AcrR family transcriptional regulator